MTAFEMLMRANLLDWPILVVGLERNWCVKKNIIQFAEKCASEAAQVDGELLTIATGESLSNPDLILCCLRYMETIGEALSPESRQRSLDQWRFSYMVLLLDGPDSVEDKINRLQELYGEFGFPEDMASCSIYSNNGIDPLTSAHIVVKQLAERLTCELTRMSEPHLG